MRWPILAMTMTVVLALSACTVGPDYDYREPDAPTEWKSDLRGGLVAKGVDHRKWWREFNDSDLTKLVDQLESRNLTVSAAWERIQAARALRGLAYANRLPDIDAKAGYTRSEGSTNTANANTAGAGQEQDLFSTGFDAVWEADLFGGLRRAEEAATADLGRAVADYGDIRISLEAELAAQYVSARLLQKRILIAERNAQTQQKTVDLVQIRLDAGLAPEADLTRARSNLSSTRAEIPSFKNGLEIALNRISVLLGEAPGAFDKELAVLRPIPTPPDQVAIGLPAELLRRRPDIGRAERILAAETARIGVAEAELYPKLSLTGTLEFQAEDAGDLIKGTSLSHNFGPRFTWNILAFGRIREQIAAADARSRAALNDYEQAMLGALEEVENLLSTYVEERRRRVHLESALRDATRSVELVKILYNEGVGDFQNVLDAERTLFNVEDRFALNEGAIATNVVQLFKALGGGWDRAELNRLFMADSEKRIDASH